MPHALFSHNPEYCVDIVHAHKPAFTPRVAFILGSGLGALADQIEDAVALSFLREIAGISRQHRTRPCW